MKTFAELSRLKADIASGKYLNPTTEQALDRTQVIVDRIMDDLEGKTDRHNPMERGNDERN